MKKKPLKLTNRKMKKVFFLVAVGSILMVLGGCQNEQKTSTDNSMVESNQAIDKKTGTKDVTDTTTPQKADKDVAVVSPSAIEDDNKEIDFTHEVAEIEKNIRN